MDVRINYIMSWLKLEGTLKAKPENEVCKKSVVHLLWSL